MLNKQIDVQKFQSTLPVRGATPLLRHGFGYAGFQSTLPVRGATGVPCRAPHGMGISIHAPRAGSDLLSHQSLSHVRNFNPRSPCGERRFRCLDSRGRAHISIHAPRAGSDVLDASIVGTAPIFQSTLPVRGATKYICFYDDAKIISIHAPRAGSDRPARC